MNRIPFLIITFGLILAGCKQADKTTASAPAQTQPPAPDDPEQLQQLVRNLYEWQETKSVHEDFVPLEQDSTYTGLDLPKHRQRLEELKQTGFFADSFLETYNQIGLTIDEGLKSKKLQWLVGEMPPFGNDANPWCNCQDFPEQYWKTITVQQLKIEEQTARFIWTWGGDVAYNVQAVKEDNQWKVAYLQGFDARAFNQSPTYAN